MPLRSTRMLPGLMSRWTRPAASWACWMPERRLADVVGGPQHVHRPGALDDLLEVGAVHELHDQEVQLLVLVDVVGADDVGMVEGGDGAGLAVEAFQRGGVVGLGGGQHLDGHPAAHQLVLAEVNAAHAAGAEAFEHLVAADGEAAPLALEELLGLEVREHAVAHHDAGELPRLRRDGVGRRRPWRGRSQGVSRPARRTCAPDRGVRRWWLAPASAYPWLTQGEPTTLSNGSFSIATIVRGRKGGERILARRRNSPPDRCDRPIGESLTRFGFDCKTLTHVFLRSFRRGATTGTMAEAPSLRTPSPGRSMALPIRHLPVLQNWDCHVCGTCCQEYVVTVTDEEKKRIDAQGWDRDADLGGFVPFVRHGPPWARTMAAQPPARRQLRLPEREGPLPRPRAARLRDEAAGVPALSVRADPDRRPLERRPALRLPVGGGEQGPAAARTRSGPQGVRRPPGRAREADAAAGRRR